ncbi:hypothetical protein [Ulvibacter litoralis]|uniref:STAS/SEC14 domain-containing protein n=1 Tax=Ulvibacter litoralis TaxID=227084 RepID=A0A1G7HKF7_9FLAO|nr:hypothetical protein [Ulvibacter litoralis]GHC58151.1 hypothetical protein GCM10008083_23530 [Ulvibacter litoralis]SDF00806.1 hypothetical protein SAMN05421855_104142 [Ulvibacter litoralis]
MTNTTPDQLNDKKTTTTLETDLGTFYITGGILMLEAKEDTFISFKTGLPTLLKLSQIMGTRPVVYISHRINSYSVDPTDYKILEKIPTLKGIAVVNTNPNGIQSAKLEKIFFKKPFKIFTDLEIARKWATTLLES